MYQIEQNTLLAHWTINEPIPDFGGPEYQGKPAATANIYALLDNLKKSRNANKNYACHENNEVVSNSKLCVPSNPDACHPCVPSNQMARLSSFSIHDRILLGRHIYGMLKTGKALYSMAIAREYGVSPGWMRSICEMVKLAPEIQDRITNMTEDEANELIRFRELFDISQCTDHDEQVSRFNKMVERNRKTWS